MFERSKKVNKYLRIRCIEMTRRPDAICVAYLKMTFWLPFRLIKNVELGEDGFTRLSIPQWLLDQETLRYRGRVVSYS